MVYSLFDQQIILLRQRAQSAIKVIDFGSSCFEHQKGKKISTLLWNIVPSISFFFFLFYFFFFACSIVDVFMCYLLGSFRINDGSGNVNAMN